MKLKKIIPVFSLIVIVGALYWGVNRPEQPLPEKGVVMYEIPEGIDPDKKIVINGHEFDPKAVYSTDPTIRRMVETAMEGAKRGPLPRFGSKDGPQRHPYTVSSADEAWYNSEVEVKKKKFEGIIMPFMTTIDGKEYKDVKILMWSAGAVRIENGRRAPLIHFRNMSKESKDALGYDIKMDEIFNQIQSKNAGVRQ